MLKNYLKLKSSPCMHEFINRPEHVIKSALANLYIIVRKDTIRYQVNVGFLSFSICNCPCLERSHQNDWHLMLPTEFRKFVGNIRNILHTYCKLLKGEQDDIKSPHNSL
jgi:hypothetical protein